MAFAAPPAGAMPMLATSVQPGGANGFAVAQVAAEASDVEATVTDQSEDSEEEVPCTMSYVQHQQKAAAAKGASHERALFREPSRKASFKRPEFWMLIFGNVLAVMAGMVDVGSILAFQVTTTHVTGSTAKLGMEVEDVPYGDNLAKVRKLGFLLLFFVLGSFLCGLIIPKGQIHFGGKSFYGTALIAESTLLILATFFPAHEAAPYLAAMSAGLQNAMCTMHFGAVIRTTHVTGTVTDIGSTSGRAAMLLIRRCFRKQGERGLKLLEDAELEVDKTKLGVLVPLYISFFAGCLLGAVAYRKMASDVFLIPAAVTGIVGVVYTFLRENLKKTFQSFEADRLNADMFELNNVLDRTRRTLHRISRDRERAESETASVRQGNEIDELDDQMRHMADLMHDVEETIEEMYEGELHRSRSH